MKKDLTIFLSLDAMDSKDFEYFRNSEKLKKYFEKISYVKEIDSVFVTNTYVAHTSIVSGCLPKNHGIIDNLFFSPGNPSPIWYWYEEDIKTNTIIKSLVENKYKVATLLWPVTAGSKTEYNFPEIFSRKSLEDQMRVSLKYGSPEFLMEMYEKYNNLLDGFKQPNLDNFNFHILKDIIKNKEVDVIFAHFVDVDSFKHKFGPGSLEAKESVNRQINNVEELFQLLESENKLDNSTIFIFGDHGCINTHTGININQILNDLNLLDYRDLTLIDYEAWFHSCGGTCFLRLKEKNNKEVENLIREKIDELIKDENSGIERYISNEEFESGGFGKDYSFGLEAKEGYYFYNIDDGKDKGTHGYSLKKPNYKTSLIVLGKYINENIILETGSILDICPTAVEILDLPKWNMDGEILNKFIKK